MTDHKELHEIVKALFEARYLKRIQRAWSLLLLGDEVRESVVEHSFYVALWGIVFAGLDKNLDRGKLLTMCITHDLEEVRLWDLNLINQMYLDKSNTWKAFEDMWKKSQLGKELIEIHNERENRMSAEAKAARDCDLLAQLVSEKEYLSKGNKEAQERIDFTLQKWFKTETGRSLAKMVIETRMTERREDIKNQIRREFEVPEKTYE